MRILGIDTSSLACSTAICQDDKILTEIYHNSGRNHSIRLMPMLDETFALSDLDLEQMDVIAVTEGPGSFTGLRIGIATAKALAFAAGKRLVAVNTLHALRYNVGSWPGIVVPILNARAQQVYGCIYQDWTLMRPTAALPLAQILEDAAQFKQPVLLLGDGVSAYRQQILDRLGDLCFIAPENSLYQRASSVAMAAKEKIERREYADVKTIVPNYYRLSQAEREYNRKVGTHV